MGQLQEKNSTRGRKLIQLFALSFLFTNLVFTKTYASGAMKPEVDEEEVVDYQPGQGEENPTDPGTPTTPTNPTTPNTPTTPGKTDPTSLNAPWKNANSSIVIDAYEGNAIDWNKMATDPKVVGVIHRSSIGSRKDTTYESRKKIAKERGYLWGAYHLGYKGNVKAQADLFLSIINNEADTLMVLDLEDTGNGTFMTVDEAVQFMQYVYDKTGKIPVVYANHSTTLQLNTKVKNNPLFQQAKLWYARFKSNLTDYPAGIWPNYFLWQFSSEINCTKTGSCLYNVPGTSFDMDVNVFNGSRSDLVQQWNNH